MKFDDSGNETSKLIKNKQKESVFPRNEEYPLLNSKFLTFLQIVNIATTAYIIVSSGFYFLVHFYGKRIIKSKSLRLEYESLLYHNLFINFFFIFSTVLGFITVKKKSLSYFFFYFFTLIMYSIIFIVSYFSEYFSDYLVNKKLIWFSYVMLFISSVLTVYCVFHFVQVLESYKTNINGLSSSGVIHEIYLRTDMLKFSFNNFMIKTKIHKLVPSLMFKKDSYYFTSLLKKEMKSESLEVESTMYKTNSYTSE
jgi:hypothetical protein